MKKALPAAGRGAHSGWPTDDYAWIEEGEAPSELPAVPGTRRGWTPACWWRPRRDPGLRHAGRFPPGPKTKRLTISGSAAEAPTLLRDPDRSIPRLIYADPREVFSLFDIWFAATQRGRLFGVQPGGFWMQVGDSAALVTAAEARLKPGLSRCRSGRRPRPWPGETGVPRRTALAITGRCERRRPLRLAPRRVLVLDPGAPAVRRGSGQGLHAALADEGPEAPRARPWCWSPTRRGARVLADAFLAASGRRAVLLPQMRPLGDLDEGEPPFEPGDLALGLPAAVAPLRRRFELACGWSPRASAPAGSRAPAASAALGLADALGGFLGQPADRGGRPADQGLADLVEADLAEHWRVSRASSWRRRSPHGRERLAALGAGRRHPSAGSPCCARLAETWSGAPAAGRADRRRLDRHAAPATADLLRRGRRARREARWCCPASTTASAAEAWAQVGRAAPARGA